jgi:hypothetical protein
MKIASCLPSPLVIRRILALCLAVSAAAPAFSQEKNAPDQKASTTLTVSPTSLAFGNEVLNVASAKKQVTVTNNATTAVTIDALSLTLSDYADSTTCPINPLQLAANASCTISVSFNPSVTGSLDTTLTVLNSSTAVPTVSLTGTGVLPVAASPSALLFGSQKVGTSSAAQTVTLTNNLTTGVTISSVASNLSDFTVTSACPISPKKLAAKSSCTASIKFKPTTTGARSGTLSFTDSATNSPQQVTLNGTGATATLTSISLSPTSASVGQGASQQFTATGNYSDGSTQNVTASSIWTSSVPTVATVSVGLASTLAQGTTSVTASSGSINASASLTVTPPALTSIALSPANPTIAVGMAQQFSAKGIFTNGSTEDLTASVSWSSSASNILSVTSGGLATSVSSGNATLTATLNALSGSTLVSDVNPTIAYYVSPTGNDSNPGTLQLPLATPQKAESLVVANYLGSHCASQTAPIVVEFLGGTWTNLSLNFTSADSGCSTAAPVVFEPYPGATVIFSGGTQVTNWVNTSGSTWQATLPATTANFEAFYYNGVRRVRPRLGSSSTALTGTYYRVAASVTGDYDRFYYNASDPISGSWENYAPATNNPCGQTPGPTNLQGDIQIAIFEYWDASWERISCIDTVNHIIYLTGSTDAGYYHGYKANHRYLVENIKDELTVPGQWFLDRSVSPWVLNYIANPGENPPTDTVMIPQQAQVITASGLRYRTFYGITFANDNFVVSSTGYAGSQAELNIPAAVQCNDCSNVTFDSDSFTNIEGYGLSFPTDNLGTATGDLIQNNAFWDIGAGGVANGRIPTGAETDANVFQSAMVQNNLVQGYGRKFPGAAAIANLLSHDVLTTHNDLTDGYSDGVMICYPIIGNNCAGNANSSGAFNQTVDYNHIWDIGQGIQDDFGTVYLATYYAAGNSINNNKVHDVTDASALDTDGYGGNGVLHRPRRTDPGQQQSDLPHGQCFECHDGPAEYGANHRGQQ